MFGRLRQRRAVVGEVDLCEWCGQVCTAGCRAQARMERAQAVALYRAGPLH